MLLFFQCLIFVPILYHMMWNSETTNKKFRILVSCSFLELSWAWQIRVKTLLVCSWTLYLGKFGGSFLAKLCHMKGRVGDSTFCFRLWTFCCSIREGLEEMLKSSLSGIFRSHMFATWYIYYVLGWPKLQVVFCL